MKDKMYRFSFMCDCAPEVIIWINRMYVRSDCTIVHSGVCMAYGKLYNGLTLTAQDVIKLATEAKSVKRGGNGNGRLN